MTNTHWNDAYTAKTPSERSWTQPSPAESLAIIQQAQLAADDAIIDIGGGASLLPDVLTQHGHTDITLLDISSSAIEETKDRLHETVQYICADITQWLPERTYALWHDRAVFHFLTSVEDQNAYRNALLTGTRSGSYLVIATFAPTGPESCSGLPVQRWSQFDLAHFFADSFDTIRSHESVHTTPWDSTQPFTWLYARRK